MMATPIGTGAILWFFIRAWISSVHKQIEEAKTLTAKALDAVDESEIQTSQHLDELRKMIQSIRLDLAEAGIKKTSEDVEKLKEKSIKFEGQMQAAWRALENLGGRDKRLSD